jgi:hypothetical protein
VLKPNPYDAGSISLARERLKGAQANYSMALSLQAAALARQDLHRCHKHFLVRGATEAVKACEHQLLMAEAEISRLREEEDE